jgi:hypothetical protein
MALSLAWHIARTMCSCPLRVPNSALFTALPRTPSGNYLINHQSTNERLPWRYETRQNGACG